MKHAKLSASGAKKWLNCPLSVMLESKMPKTESVYAEEGTKAHALSELKLKRNLNLISKDTYDSELNKLDVCPEMDRYTDYYCDAVLEIVHKYDRNYSMVKLEERVDFSPWVIKGFGTSDVIVISDNIIEIIDLKYGKGVLVSAENNPQLMLYALGVLNDYGYLYNIEKVIMTIVQPRLDNISSFSISIPELLEWGQDVKVKAIKAYNGEGECVVGNHCDECFCRARAICKAYADEKLEIAKYEFKGPEELDVNDLSDILSKIDKLVAWGNIVKKYALNQALDGVTINGYKLVEGRSNRAYGVDESRIASILISNGYDEHEIYEKSIKSVSSMEKWLGKSKFKSILGDLVIKPPGKPTLVPVDDPRQEFNSAINDFKERE